MAAVIEQSAGAGGPLGAWRMRRLAERWSRAPVRAVAFLRRPDDVKWALEATGTPIAPRVMLDTELRERPNAATQELTKMQLLILDQFGTLHLVGLEGWLLAQLRDELMQWPVDEVTVTVKPGKGKFRAVEIVSSEGTLLLAGPWKNDRQREALELIEGETGGQA